MAHFQYGAIQFHRWLEPPSRKRASAAIQQMKTAQHQMSNINSAKTGADLLDVNADSQSVVVNAPVAEVYHCCLRFEEFPWFITSIMKIDRIDDTHFSCASVINGEEVKSDVQIVMRVPDRRIAWQAVSDHFRVGVVSFDPLLEGATKVTVKVRSIIEPVMLTGALGHYLRNFKVYVENGSAKK
jgi:uncharacterized membrane protein